MALNIDGLADELVSIYKTTVTKTEYDPTTGFQTTKIETVYPDRDKMKLLSEALINHITKNSEVNGVQSTVNATVAPGITVATSGGPGSTTSPGTATGTGTQSILVRVKQLFIRKDYMTECEWEKKETLGIVNVLNDTFSLLENVLKAELESLEKKARLLEQLTQMKNDGEKG